MSVSAFFVALALVGQATSEDRYGNPPAASSPSSSIPPLTTKSRSNSQPPPPLTPPMENDRVTTPQRSETSDTAPLNLTPRNTAPLDTAPLGAANLSTTSGPKPSELMRAMLTAPSGSRLSGRPVTLTEVVASATSRQEQSQRVDAYWDLCSSVADYYLGVREQDELRQLRATVSKFGPIWQQAESELGVRIGTSQRAAVASQHRLASLMGWTVASSLPLPTDLPHCGDYNARYDQIFAGRQSVEAQALSELLPMRYEESKDAALAITRAEEFLNAIASQRNSANDGTGTLRALELLALRRRAFVQIVRDYNRRIARYTELATPGQIDAARLIGMLIKREDDATATRPSSSALLPNRQSQSPPNDVTPATFAEGWEPLKSRTQSPRDKAVKPASSETQPPPRREHSLLVPSE